MRPQSSLNEGSAASAADRDLFGTDIIDLFTNIASCGMSRHWRFACRRNRLLNLVIIGRQSDVLDIPI